MTELAGAVAEAAARLGPRARRDVPIGPLTTYRVGGSAAVFVDVDDEADLAALAAAVAATGAPTLAVGRGSNLLVADRGFPGIAFRLGDAFAAIDRSDDDPSHVLAGGAASLPVVARRTVGWSLSGFEWAVGVPGSIGGAVRMNAGGHGSDMAATLVRVRVVDLQGDNDDVVPASALDLRYRGSSIGPASLVVWAELGLEPGDRAGGEALLSEIVQWRRANQPGGQNAGSVFTNPPDDSAGRLVDVAGGKGLRIGSAEVSTKHANFIQADEGGSADDVRALMDEVRARVRAQTGVELVPETCLVGFDP
ncbi:MAG: UDP-N-acetylmuramate dehydrogenase [Acidimicrobiia bacterium]|nr:UDP-N-acetylmuramate dehydrogenase [Acidimicrobiia bacterium]